MARDEAYIIDLCDRLIGMAALRQHRFAFLPGDPGLRGVCRRLPVDAFYPALSLAIEYRERQHSEPVAIMDSRMTISGCSRGEHRRRYDERRRIELPRHGIRLLELDVRMFGHDARKRLKRNTVADEVVLRSQLSIAHLSSWAIAHLRLCSDVRAQLNAGEVSSAGRYCR